MLPVVITFTGLDDQTDLEQCASLSRDYPIEWGVLVGGRVGKQRYPSDETLIKVLDSELDVALHMCGPAAKWMNDGMPLSLKALKEISPVAMVWLSRANRIQVNRAEGAYDIDEIDLAMSIYDLDLKVILQHRGPEFPRFHQDERFQFLQDESGGKGKSTEQWALTNDPYDIVGYAGGLNPDNVAREVARMTAFNFWIDMETGVRTDDWLDLDKCRAVCEAVYGK